MNRTIAEPEYVGILLYFLISVLAYDLIQHSELSRSLGPEYMKSTTIGNIVATFVKVMNMVTVKVLRLIVMLLDILGMYVCM